MGYFKEELKAVTAYDAAAGRLGRATNFPLEDYKERRTKRKDFAMKRRCLKTLKNVDYGAIYDLDENGITTLSSAPNSLAKEPKLLAPKKSSFVGVHWVSKEHRWRCMIRDSNGKKLHIGYYDDEFEAAQAYDNKAKLLGITDQALNFSEYDKL